MATLDNFHTGNHPQPLYPTLRARHAQIREGLHQNSSWDPANAAPVAPSPTYEPGSVASAHPNPQVEERLTFRGMKDYLVPTHPRTRFRYNDTVSGVQLYSLPPTRSNFWARLFRTEGGGARVSTVSRFHPYQR